MERLSDDTDIAAARQQQANEQAVLERRHAEAQRRAAFFAACSSGEFDGFCECGEDVPQARRDLFYMTCIRCATKAEQLQKLRTGK